MRYDPLQTLEIADFGRPLLESQFLPSPSMPEYAHPGEARPQELYEMAFIDQRKGCGVVATDDIKAGTEIILERAAIICDYPQDKLASNPEDLNKRIAGIVQAMGVDFAQSFLTLPSANRDDLGIFDAIVTASHIPIIMTGTATAAAVGLNSAYLNHACIPNSYASVVELKLSESYDEEDRNYWISVRACMDITQGSEITVSYRNHSMPSELRKQELEKQFDFECLCDQCEYPSPRIEGFLAVFMGFNKAIYDPKIFDSHPAWVLHGVYRMSINMIRAGIIDVRYPVLWEHCAVVCSWHSDIGRAMMFLKKAQVGFKRIEGSAGQNYLRMKLWYERPELMPAHGVSQRGLSNRNDISLLLMNPEHETSMLFMMSAENDGYIRLCDYRGIKSRQSHNPFEYLQDGDLHMGENQALTMTGEHIDQFSGELTRAENREIGETRLRGGRNENQEKKDRKGKAPARYYP
jgi:SET domain